MAHKTNTGSGFTHSLSKFKDKFKEALSAPGDELAAPGEGDDSCSDSDPVAMARHFDEAFWGSQGFDALHRYIKQGKDFCRDFAGILQERADLEKTNARKLESLCTKARTMSALTHGTLSTLWQRVQECMEAEAQVHRNMQATFMEELCKPLRHFVDEQSKVRRPAEDAAQKSHKAYMERRSDDAKKKNSCLSKANDHESLCTQLNEARNRQGKDIAKLEAKCRKAEESLLKADQDYHDHNRRTEEARQKWEKDTYCCCTTLEKLEVERLNHMKEALDKYAETLKSVIPVVQSGCFEISQSAREVAPLEDVAAACATYGTAPNRPEQLLYEAYEENFGNGMDEDRRRHGLERKIQEYEEDVQRELKVQGDVLNLLQTYIKTPDFADASALASAGRQLFETTCMVNFLIGNRHKLMMAKARLEGTPPPAHSLMEFISHGADRAGRPVTTLKVPLQAILHEGFQDSGSDYRSVMVVMPSYLGGRDEESLIYSQPTPHESLDAMDDSWAGPSHDYCEIEDKKFSPNGQPQYLSTCHALYAYEPQQEDELQLEPDDIIYVTEKMTDDWWKGEMNGQLGIFPATYVEEHGSPPPENGNHGDYAFGLSS